MKVAVTGATGMIGGATVRALADRGDEVTVLTRDPERARGRFEGMIIVGWERPEADPCPSSALSGRDAVINLLGESVAQRWSERARRAIRDSRVLGTRNLIQGLRAADPRPGVLVSQSATGYYGARGGEAIDEDSAPAGPGDFLSEAVVAWEAEARTGEDLGVRVVRTRTGVVLAPRGGALEKMLPPFRLGVGGPVAGGGQYVPWVHLDDVVGALLFCLDTLAATGPINVTAPEPATNRELSRTLGRVLGRPAVLPVPAAALRLLYGDMASVVTTGARVLPARLAALGYSFHHPHLEEALRAALAARSPVRVAAR